MNQGRRWSKALCGTETARGKRGAPCGAGLLRVGVGEKRALIRDAVDVGRLVTHHAAAIGADVPETDVVTPDDNNIGLFLLRLCGRLNNRR